MNKMKLKKLNLNDYEKMKTLGKGTFGVVYQIQKKESDITYAAKEEISTDENKTLLIEMKSYSKIDNNAILSLIGYSPKNFDGDPNPIIVTSYMSNGSLDKILNKCRKSLTPTEFTSTKKYIILIGVALGMKYLHNKGIIHRDLKPGNILLDDDFNPRICDFGCSVVSDKKLSQILMKTQVGTPLYMAPEICSDDDVPYTYKVDIYAYSYIMYEIITSHLPFSGKIDPFKFMNEIIDGKRPDLSIVSNHEIEIFLSKCWSANPNERPSFSQIVDFLMQKKVKDFFNVDEDEVLEYLDNFDDELKNLYSKEALDVKKEADNGSIEAMMTFAEMLYHGKGVEIDLEKSFYYFQKVADLGNVDAMFNIAFIKNCEKDCDYNEVVKLYQKAIAHGSTDAMINYARMCFNGLGIPVNKKEALKYYKLAADAGEVDIMFLYGSLLYNGDGCEIDKKEAAKYYKRAADNDYPEANFRYACMLHRGDGIEANTKEAIRYYKKAVDQGYQEAMFNLGVIYHDGEGIGVDMKKAAQYIQMASDEENERAMYDYGVILSKGEGIEKNNKEAAKYFKKSADKGNPEAMFHYALMSLNGEGIPINKKEGIKYIKMAVDKGELNAISVYGNMLLNGGDVEMNKEEGIRLLKLACDEGNETGIINFANALKDGDGIKEDKEKAAQYFKKLADEGNINCKTQYGLMLYTGEGVKQDWNEAEKYLKQSIEANDSKAMYIYGGLLYKKSGLNYFNEESLSYIKKAADLGNSDAQLHYGIQLHEKNQYSDESLYYIKKAADQENLEAMFFYGSFLILQNKAENEKEGYKYLEDAASKGDKQSIEILKKLKPNTNNIKYVKMSADNGNIESMIDYAQRLYRGVGIPANISEAAKYFKMAADKGNKDAMYMFARMIRHGEGVPIDMKESIKYYKLASEKGNDLAMINLGHIYSNGEGVQVDKKESTRYYKMAADHCNINAKFMYGQALIYGIGTDENLFLGLSLVKEAAQKGCKEAILLENQFQKVGDDFLSSLNKSSNHSNENDSIENIKIAADNGDIDAMFSYGKMKLIGVDKNLKEASFYLRKAADKGHIESMKIMAGLMIQNKNREEATRYLLLAANHGDLVSFFLYRKLFK